jgi:hypothetical protein
MGRPNDLGLPIFFIPVGLKHVLLMAIMVPNHTTPFISMRLIKQLLRPVLALVIGLLLAGCVTAGKDFNVHMVRQIQLQQTTRAQIEQMFGPPWRTGLEDGKQTWSYGYYKHSLSDTMSRDLVVRFNPNGTVASYSFNSNYPEDQKL